MHKFARIACMWFGKVALRLCACTHVDLPIANTELFQKWNKVTRNTFSSRTSSLFLCLTNYHFQDCCLSLLLDVKVFVIFNLCACFRSPLTVVAAATRIGFSTLVPALLLVVFLLVKWTAKIDVYVKCCSSHQLIG